MTGRGRRGCSVLPYLVFLAIVSLSSLAGVATRPETSEVLATPATAGGGSSAASLVPGAAHPVPTPSLASGNPAAVAVLPSSVPDVSELATANRELTSTELAPTLQGTWSYADPAYGPHYLAIPNGPGWRVTICGPAACLERVSTDAGPVLPLQREGRIGDLSAVMFETLCGMTPAQRVAVGLCPGTVTILGRAPAKATLPPTAGSGDRVLRSGA